MTVALAWVRTIHSCEELIFAADTCPRAELIQATHDVAASIPSVLWESSVVAETEIEDLVPPSRDPW